MESKSPIIESASEARLPVSANARKKQVKRSAEQRRRIVEETFEPGMSVAAVARRHGINANQIFTWRRRYRDGKLGGGTGAALQGFIPVAVIDGAAAPASPAGRRAPERTETYAGGFSSWPVEVELKNGIKVRFKGADDGDMRRVLHVVRELA